MRTFIGFALPEEGLAAVRAMQTELMARRFRVRWVRPDNIHLTLKFLGDVEPREVGRIAAALGAAALGHTPLRLAVRAAGVFPDIRRARVIWAGLSGQVDALNRLHRSIDERLATLGYAAETRPFSGHLTLGRARAKIDPKQLAAALAALETGVSTPFTVDTLVLFKSDLKPSGAVYTKLEQIFL